MHFKPTHTVQQQLAQHRPQKLKEMAANGPPPEHKGRKGGVLWEELLHTLPADLTTLPFYQDEPARVAEAEARKAEVMSQTAPRNSAAKDTSLYEDVRAGKRQFVHGKDSVKDYLTELMKKEILMKTRWSVRVATAGGMWRTRCTTTWRR